MTSDVGPKQVVEHPGYIQGQVPQAFHDFWCVVFKACYHRQFGSVGMVHSDREQY